MSTAATSPDKATHSARPSTWWDTAALGLLALLVAGPGLGTPAAFVFDEIYYVSDAYSHLEVGVGRGFQAHPPLGYWLVAAGIALVSSPAGWRLSSLVLGVITVLALHRLAVNVLPQDRRGRLLALAPPALLIADGSWLVLSRTAMLDGPLTAFVVIAVAAAVTATKPGAGLWPRVLLAGIATGAAISVKWSGALLLPLVAVVFVLGNGGTSLAERARRSIGPVLATTGIALLVYAAAWVPFATFRDDVPIGHCTNVAEPCPEAGGVTGVVAQHAMLVRYHTRIVSDDAIASPPSLWPLLRDPIGFYRPSCHTQSTPVDLPTTFDAPPGCDLPVEDGEDTIAYRGNVVVWLGFAALLPVVVAGARRRDRAAQVALAGWALQWLPWLLATRVSYLWYMAPTVPFVALGLVAAARVLPTTRITRVYVLAAVGAAVGALVTATTPVPAATLFIGWGLGGWAGARRTRVVEETPTASLVTAGMITVGAGIVAVINHSSWTVG